MDAKIKALKDWGCDTVGALARMVDDEEFYLDCLGEIPDDPGFDELEAALAAGDVKRAFDNAHTLKGVLGNMGLTPMYELSIQIVEPLRLGELPGDLTEKVARLQEMRGKLTAIVRGEAL